MRVVLRSACALLLTLGLCRPASADLTPTDTTNLTSALQTLSFGWDDTAHGTAYFVFAKAQYTASDWQTFFDGYFNTTGHAVTDLLRDYLGYYLFFYFTPDVRIDIQLGILAPLFAKGAAIVAAHPSDLGTAIFQEPIARQTMFNVHKLHARLYVDDALDVAVRSQVSERYRLHILQYPGYWGDAGRHDPVAEPALSYLRAQVWLSYIDALPATTARDAEIATTIGLTGTKLAIWNAFGTLIMDNDSADAAQLGALEAMLTSLPAPLTTPRYLTLGDLFVESVNPYQPLIAKGQQGGGYNYLMELVNNRVHLSFDGVPNVSWAGITADTPITYDAWNHVAATYDGATMRVYVGGVLRGSQSAPGAPASWSTQPLQIGRADDFQLYFRGAMDDVRIWNRALSGSEITAAAAGQSITMTGNVARYLMNEASGTGIADGSGTGNHATASGAPIVSGRTGNGRFFDGETQWVQAPDSATLRFSGAFTLEAWVYVANQYVPIEGGGSSGINTYGIPIGAASENPFPADAAPRFMDAFCTAAAHELSHIIRTNDIVTKPLVAAREEALIGYAGTTPLQYLRSGTVEQANDYFVNNPQEFFAGMANQYFADTANTLALGLSRYTGGYSGPLSQFVFFADVLSGGLSTTRAYTTDQSCTFGATNVPVTRDSQGRLVTFTLAGTTHNFGLDASGHVISHYTGVPHPDLALSSFTASINSTEKVSIQNTFVNQGTAATAGTFVTTFYLSADQGLDGGDVVLGSRSRTAALASGASSAATNAFSVSASVTPGSYYVLGMVDSGNTQAESFEINNIAVSAGTLNIRPDLAGHSISVTRSGTTLDVTDSIANDGPLSTSGGFRIDYYLSLDATLDGGDVLIGNRTVSGTLAANANSQPTTTSLAVPQALPPGSYRVLSNIDAGQAVSEVNEANNVDSTAPVPLKPDLVAVSLTASASGRTVTFVDSVRNDGALPASAAFTVEYRLSVDQTITTSDPLLGQRTIASLAPGATSSATTPLTAPVSVPAGSYYGAVWVDRLKVVTDASATNNKLATATTVTIP